MPERQGAGGAERQGDGSAERRGNGSAERRVLVVDDDPSIQGFLAEALADEGYEVRTASNGREALAVLEIWRPDLILLDLMMPEMDGWTFRAEQRTTPGVSDVPVIMLSAARDLDARTRALEPVQVFSKPFDLEVLLGTIERLTA